MKPDIVFFSENLGEAFHRQLAIDKDDVDLLIIMGSSMKIVINNEPLSNVVSDVQLIGDLDVILDELCLRLGELFLELCIDAKRQQRVSVPFDSLDFKQVDEQAKTDDGPEQKRQRLDSINYERKLLTEMIDAKTQYIFQEPARSIFDGARVYVNDIEDDTMSTISDSSSASDESDRPESRASLPARLARDEDDSDDDDRQQRARSI